MQLSAEKNAVNVTSNVPLS